MNTDISLLNTGTWQLLHIITETIAGREDMLQKSFLTLLPGWKNLLAHQNKGKHCSPRTSSGNEKDMYAFLAPW